MPVSLGNYEWLATAAIDFGFPVIGAALGVPALAPVAASMLKKALGMSDRASLETVQATIQADPDAGKAAFEAANTEAAAKWDYLARVFEARAKADEANIGQVNETIRAEVAADAAKPNGWWGHWRTWMAYELMLECPFWAALIGWCIVNGKINELVASASILTVWWAARFGVLGVHVWTGNNERQTAITGAPPASALTTAVTAIKTATGVKR